MKRIFLLVYTCLFCVSLQAQTTDGYLTDGDYVTISYNNDWGNTIPTTYLEASTGGLRAVEDVSDSCLWILHITDNGLSYSYTFENVTMGVFLAVNNNGSNNTNLMLVSNSAAASAFHIGDPEHQKDKYLYGALYYNANLWGGIVPLYVGSGYSVGGDWFAGFKFYIEKWEKHGADGGSTAHFNPAKVEYTYVENDDAAQQQRTMVEFVLEGSTETYYQCVNRPNEMLLGRKTEGVDPTLVSDVKVYWASTSNKEKVSTLVASNFVACKETSGRSVMTLSDITKKDGTNDTWQFTITPNGKSPMELQQYLFAEENVQGILSYVDYIDNVVVEYTYNDQINTQSMRVVRNSYHEEELPSLTFSINPVTYTFRSTEEDKVFDVVPTHQHGSVIYNVNNQVFSASMTTKPTPVQLTDGNLKLELFNGWTGLVATRNGDYKIKVSTPENGTEQKRSAELRGTLTCGTGVHEHSATFVIPLSQRSTAGGIQFYTQAGKGATAEKIEAWNRLTDQQNVHTAERTIYYMPGEEIELRLPESGYSGYMRWYDYNTGSDPTYNYDYGQGDYCTSWILSPRAADNSAFSAINTPASASDADQQADGVSHGLYAINKAGYTDGVNSVIGILNEDATDNKTPILKGWNYTNYQPNPGSLADSLAGGYHTMACDVSAYTDYMFEFEQGQITSITEPTLSYRQFFHLKPAEEIANKLAALESDEYLEEYHYQAPVGQEVLLSTEYRYLTYRYHISEMCYFYWDNANPQKLHRVVGNNTTVHWKKDGNRIANPNDPKKLDYLSVEGDSYEGNNRVVYTLTITPADGPELRIARFVVDFVDIERQGPTTQTIITQQRIKSQYNQLAYINFEEYNSHLPWNYTSYGYVYNEEPLNDDKFKRGANQGVFPFYGEYTIVDKNPGKGWADQAPFSGKSLYVDGTMEPGLVATLSTKAVICSGQTLYCSAWFCNPTPQGWGGSGNATANPIFRCNVQGRDYTINAHEDTVWGEWENAGVYFVGELLQQSGWRQVVFPINSAHSYKETRVSIYNFATTNNGNDFMVDDISLFVSRLPIAAYQGKMACRSTDTEKTSAAAILRLDYSNINAGADGYMYYQIYNESYEHKEGDKVISKGEPVRLVNDEGYYHDNTTDHDTNNQDDHYGSVSIPPATFNPSIPEHYQTLQEKGIDTLGSVSKLLDLMAERGQKHAKAYVRTVNSGEKKWLLYVAHIIDNVTDNDMTSGVYKDLDEAAKTQLPLQYLYDKHSYSMRMAYTPAELATPACNMTTPLHATQQTVFTLRNSDQKFITHSNSDGVLTANGFADQTTATGVNIFNNSNGNCANDVYFLTAKIVNNLAIDGAGGEIKQVEAPIFADWLIGDPAGDVLSEKVPTKRDDESEEAFQQRLNDYNTRLQTSIKGFEKMYGYTHGQVSTAIMYDMRRFATDDPNNAEYNPNYYAKTFEELQPSKFLSMQNYEIIKHLYDNGWLQFYKTTVHFYLGSEDKARYWCFPIAETAKAKVDGLTDSVVLKDCNEPRRVVIAAAHSDYHLNVAPIIKADKTPQQKIQIPTVKVVANEDNTITSVTLPIKEIANITVGGSAYQKDESISFDLRSSLDYLSFFDLETGTTIDKPTSFTVGEEYTLRLRLGDTGGYEYPGNNSGDLCRVGYIFFTIQVVPNTLVWQPTGTSFNGWGKNENWKGWIDKNGDGRIDSTEDPETNELVEGYVPMKGTDVIIPNLDNPLLYPYIVPEHEHDHYPMAVHHDQHRCSNIYFAAGAHINNQHLLDYEKAFVDMPIRKDGWHMMSAPLKSMYSGDMYIPHSGTSYVDPNAKNEESIDPFVVAPFQGSRTSSAPYAFWASYYNQTVKNWYEDGTTTEPAAAAEFLSSNGLDQPLSPGSGFMLYGAGPDNFTEEELIVRLPKPHDTYISSSGNNVPVQRNGLAHKFAFDADHDNQNMEITLQNKIESEYFLFGNPTMAFINMHDFLHDNEGVLNHVFYRIENGTWNAETEHTMGDNRFLAPMTSVMLEAKDKKQSLSFLTVTLKSTHLTLNNQVSPFSADNSETPSPAPRRAATSKTRSSVSEIMTIYALTDDAYARTILAVNPAANDYYLQGEDAISMSSGVENTSYITTPVNMYTLAEKVPMMADIRQGISHIPVNLLVDKDYRTDYMQFAFYLSSNWKRECYFRDSITGTRYRIMDGLVLTLPMPQNHEQRYFIEGPDEYVGSSNGDGTSTSTTNPSTNEEASFTAYSLSQASLHISSNQLIQEVTLYDLAGRVIVQRQLDLFHSAVDMPAPSGMCLVKVTLRNGTTLYRQALVR